MFGIEFIVSKNEKTKNIVNTCITGTMLALTTSILCIKAYESYLTHKAESLKQDLEKISEEGIHTIYSNVVNKDNIMEPYEYSFLGMDLHISSAPDENTRLTVNYDLKESFFEDNTFHVSIDDAERLIDYRRDSREF